LPQQATETMSLEHFFSRWLVGQNTIMSNGLYVLPFAHTCACDDGWSLLPKKLHGFGFTRTHVLVTVEATVQAAKGIERSTMAAATRQPFLLLSPQLRQRSHALRRRQAVAGVNPLHMSVGAVTMTETSVPATRVQATQVRAAMVVHAWLRRAFVRLRVPLVQH